MELLGLMIVIVGVVILIIGNIQFLIAAYYVGFWWLMGVIFVPLVDVLFLIFHFSEAWPSTKRILFGSFVVLAGVLLGSYGQA